MFISLTFVTLLPQLEFVRLKFCCSFCEFKKLYITLIIIIIYYSNAKYIEKIK